MRIVLQQLARRIQTVQVGHADIDNNDVRIQLKGFLDCFATIAGFAAHFPALVLLKQRAQTSAHDFMIVGQQNSESHNHCPLKAELKIAKVTVTLYRSSGTVRLCRAVKTRCWLTASTAASRS